MSHRLYSTRVFYHDRHGIAKLHGLLMQLTESPCVDLVDIDYAPEVSTGICRSEFSAWRDLTDSEIHTLDVFLFDHQKEMM